MESEKPVCGVCIFSETLEATEVLNKKRNRNENVFIGLSIHTSVKGKEEAMDMEGTLSEYGKVYFQPRHDNTSNTEMCQQMKFSRLCSYV